MLGSLYHQDSEFLRFCTMTLDSLYLLAFKAGETKEMNLVDEDAGGEH